LSSGDILAPTKVRCGSYNLRDMDEGDLCFCDNPLKQPRLSFRFSIRLADRPYQWTENARGVSTLKDADSDNFKRHILAAMTAVN